MGRFITGTNRSFPPPCLNSLTNVQHTIDQSDKCKFTEVSDMKLSQLAKWREVGLKMGEAVENI